MVVGVMDPSHDRLSAARRGWVFHDHGRFVLGGVLGARLMGPAGRGFSWSADIGLAHYVTSPPGSGPLRSKL